MASAWILSTLKRPDKILGIFTSLEAATSFYPANWQQDAEKLWSGTDETGAMFSLEEVEVDRLLNSEDPEEEEAIKDSRFEAAHKLLPAWFVSRMLTDSWGFGLMMSNGQTIPINSIHAVHQAADQSIWLDVELLTDQEEIYWHPPATRLKASINASHVIAAFEIWDS